MLTDDKKNIIDQLISNKRSPTNGFEIHFLCVVNGQAAVSSQVEQEWFEYWISKAKHSLYFNDSQTIIENYKREWKSELSGREFFERQCDDLKEQIKKIHHELELCQKSRNVEKLKANKTFESCRECHGNGALGACLRCCGSGFEPEEQK